MNLSFADILAARKRLVDKIDIRGTDECWPWLASTDRAGYGRIAIAGKYLQATHAVFCLVRGWLPQQQILHSCDFPSCVNPKHLREGTQAENHQDRMLRDRAPRGEKHWTQTKPERIARGERHGSRFYPRPRKLETSKHAEIYSRFRSGALQKQLATEYGVSKQLISKIICQYQP